MADEGNADHGLTALDASARWNPLASIERGQARLD
ncbi:MAG: hypothetical protein QOH17_2608 [Pseudonocardiales bacterium]|jgi:hypothetical protein|nr:hypothetical protein [Pseudonocardiales bacterium]